MRTGIYETELQDLDRTKINCSGVIGEQLAERFKWLEIAAAAGNDNAVYLFATQGSPLLENPDAMLKDPEKLVSFKNKARSFLSAAVGRCSVEAMALAGQGYETGLLFPEDRELGFAMQLVAQRLSEGYQPPPGEHSTEENMTEKMANRIFVRYCL